jgi:hypothetical protein
MTPIGRISTVLLGGWCLFWWGHALGAHFAYKTEVRSLDSRLKMWRAVLKEKGEETQVPARLQELDEERLSELQIMTELPLLQFILAPITEPYAAYELHQMRLSK